MAERIRNLQPGEASYSNSLKRPTSAWEPACRFDSRRTRAESFCRASPLRHISPQRAGAVSRIRQALMQHLHDRKTGVEADEIGELQWTHRGVGAELHRRVEA